MSTIQYIPTSLPSSVSSLRVSCIFACAHPPEQTGTPDQMTNHWVLNCAIKQTEYLRIDPSPSGLNSSMVLIVSKRSYADSVKTVQISTAGLTFGRLLELVVSQKYGKYQFSPAGQGCRFWVSKVIELLRSEGYVNSAMELQAAISALHLVWDSNSQPLPFCQQSPVVAGRFLEH